MRETARQQKVCTQMGNQGTATPGLPPRRRDRPGRAPSGRSGRSTSGPTARSSTGSRPRTSSRGPRTEPVPDARALGPVPRHGPRAALQPRLPSPRLARLVGLRHRRAGRHGLPHGQPGLHGPAARPARRGSPPRAAPINPETYPAWATITYEFPGPRRPAAGQAHLVRGRQGRPAQPPARRPLPQGLQAVGQRLAADRRDGPDVLPQRLRRGAGALARGEVQGPQGPRAHLPAHRGRARRGRQPEARVGRGHPGRQAQVACRTSTTPRR